MSSIKNSDKLCPRCTQEPIHLRYADSEPVVAFDWSDGYVHGVALERYCIACGYREVGHVTVLKNPTWKEKKDS